MPSNTPNIDLYKKNPTTDGEDTFNIETMLNENWDKIDARFGSGMLNDDLIGTRTATDNVIPAFTGKITPLLSSLFTLLKGVTGKPSALTAPRTTLENAVKRDGDTMTGTLTVPKLISTVATGTAPLTVASTTQVDNLNADMVNGYRLNQSVKTTDSPTFAGVNVNKSGDDAAVRFANTGAGGRTYLLSSGSGSSGLGAGNFGIWDDVAGRRFVIDSGGHGRFYNSLSLADDNTPNDATLHIKDSTGGQARLTQMSPKGSSKDALNIVASKSAASTDQWWAWGVNAANKFRINVGTVFSIAGLGLTIDSNSNMFLGSIDGISTAGTSPTARRIFSVKGITDSAIIELAQGAVADAANVVAGQVYFSDSSNTASEKRLSGIVGYTDSNSATANARGGAISFYTRSDGTGGTYTEKMRIDMSGRIGIGTTDPQATLDLGTGSGQRLYVYKSAGVRLGLGIDMSGIAGRELALFAAASNANYDNDARVSIGGRVDATGAYMQYANFQSNGLWLGKPSVNDADSSTRKVITFQNGGFAPPGGFHVNSNGDKVILFDSVGANYDGRIGVGQGSNMWFKSSGVGSIGSFEFYVGSAPTKTFSIGYNGALAQRADNNWAYNNATFSVYNSTANPSTIGMYNANFGGSIVLGYSGFNGFQFYNTAGSYATVALGELQSTNVVTPLINSKNIFDSTTHSNAVGLATGIPWRNFGTNHKLVDNSDGGYGGGNVNSASAWQVSYGLLVGYNGGSTYGVKVDRARQAEGLRVYSGSDPAAAVGEMWMRSDL